MLADFVTTSRPLNFGETYDSCSDCSSAQRGNRLGTNTCLFFSIRRSRSRSRASGTSSSARHRRKPNFSHYKCGVEPLRIEFPNQLFSSGEAGGPTPPPFFV